MIAVILTFLMFSGIIAEASNDVKVYVNGKRVEEDVILSNDRTYIPLRAVSEALGAQVSWDGTSRSAMITFSEDDAIANRFSHSNKYKKQYIVCC